MRLPDSVEARAGALEGLVARALEHLAKLEYKESTREQYAKTWSCFLRFVRECGGGETRLTSLSDAFLSACARKGHKHYRRRSGQLLMKTGMRVLTEFALTGCFQVRAELTSRIALPANLESALLDYLRFSKEHMHHRGVTLKARARHIRRFFHHLHSRGIDSVGGIDAAVVSGFLASRTHLHPTTFRILVGSVRSLLRFLRMGGQVSGEAASHLDEFRVQVAEPVPLVWSREHVAALLGAVDRSSPVGKRDYAILLLAAQLGMRSTDIRQLRLDNIQWEQSRIDLRQSKTGEPLSLPLSEEVGAALIDYLRHGRPRSSRPEVFLRANAPFVPMAVLVGVISRYRCRAGIALPPPPRWSGMHSLRHSLASRLLEADTSFEVIAAVLGHRCERSTRSYIRIDVESLREVALDLKEADHARA